MPVILYWGEEDFNIDNALEELKKKILDESWSAINRKVLKEPDITTLLESIETTPMMFGNLLIEIHSTVLFTRSNVSKSLDNNLLERLIQDLESLSPNIYVVFVCKIERESSKKIDSAKKIVKTIKKIGEVQEFPAFKSYQEDKVIGWIKQSTKKKDISIDNQGAAFLVFQVGTNLRKLDTELEKLKTFVYPEKNIKKEDIQKLCSDTDNIFRMTDFWLEGKKDKALSELKKLFEKNEPVRIIATMQSLLKRWIRIKLESKTKSAQEISQIVNLHPYVVEQDIKKLKNISVEQLKEDRKKLNNAEFNIKSGKIHPETSLEIVIAS